MNSNSGNLRGFTDVFAKEFVVPQITFWQSNIDPGVKIGSGLMSEYYEDMRAAVRDLKKKFSPPYYSPHGFSSHEVVITVEEVEMLKGLLGDNYRYLKDKIEKKKSLGVAFMSTSKEEKALENLETYLTHVAPSLGDAREKALWVPFEQLGTSKKVSNPPTSVLPQEESEFDIFISHASEDKSSFVEPLAEALKKEGVRVWYDDFELKWGDSLRGSIDRGLKRSRYGIVVLSKSFLAKKKWTEHELDGLFALEEEGKKVILPIWHDVTREDVLTYSPSLADRLAKRSDKDDILGIVASIKEIL